MFYYNKKNKFDIINYVADKHKNQKYGDKDYMYHILGVKNICDEFIDKYDWSEYETHVIETSVLCHDLLEDTNVTYVELIDKFGKDVAEKVFNLSGFGKTRKERNFNAYSKMKGDKISIFVKLCDRIFNTQESKNNNERLFKMYKNEYLVFKKYLFSENELEEMWSYLDELNFKK